MSGPPRIELADPSPEGQRIAEVLRERGFYVVERSIESLHDGSTASLVLLGGEADGAIAALRALRSGAKSTLTALILLGDPPEPELASSKDDDQGSPKANADPPGGVRASSAGGPRATTKAIIELGADAHYSRPVSIERLVRKVETFLAPPETRLKSQPMVESTSPPRPDLTVIPEAAPREPTQELREPSIDEWRPPERTMQLADASTGPKRSSSLPPLSGALRKSKPPSVTPPPVRSSHPPPRSVPRASPPPLRPSQPPIGSPRDSEPPVEAADLSPRLRRLILDADRRVFPASPPLDLRFAAGDETPDELVPDELLEVVPVAAEPVEEDPLDAFTYVGPVPEHSLTPLPGGAPDPNRAWLSSGSEPAISVRAELSGPGSVSAPSIAEVSEVKAAPPPRDVTVSRSSETQDEIGFGERTERGRGRRGELGEADALRLLWRALETGDDVRVTLELEGLPPLRLRIARDDLCAFDGPVASRVLAFLEARGRAPAGAVSPNEESAQAALDAMVASGTLGRFELDRLLRRAREDILFDAVASTGGSFDLRPTGVDGPAATRLLARPLATVLVEGARRRLGPSRVRRLVGGGALALSLTPLAAARFERAGIEPELVSLLVRSEGALLDEVIDAAPPEEGVAGAVYALIAAGALRLAPSEGALGRTSDPAAAARAAIEAAARLAEDGTYFAVLGVSPDAAPRDLRAAWETRRRELSELRLGPLGLEELEPRVRLALDAVDEAFEVLEDPELCESYRLGLAI